MSRKIKFAAKSPRPFAINWTGPNTQTFVLDIDEIAWIATDVILALLALLAFVGWWRWR